MEQVKIIKDYIMFLKTRHQLAITLHPLKKEGLISMSELIGFNIHENSYCAYVKSCNMANAHCVCRQPKILEKLERPFVGVCYAGVKEYIYPIYNGRENVGFISVSGYQAEGADSYIRKIAREYELDYESLKNIYASLHRIMPPREEVDTLLLPLCNLLELAYRKSKNVLPADEALPQRVVNYLKVHRNEDINSEDICRECGCSRSYMSSQFNKYTGMSIREYINMLRIEDAKRLLDHTKLTVTEIAFSVGYTDSNYFTVLFKKITGMSPLTYRKGVL